MNDEPSKKSDGYGGCEIPPEVYDIGFGWDPQPEVERMLFLARSNDVNVTRALEIGCGTGRLFPAFNTHAIEIMGLELSPAMAMTAHERTSRPVIVGDMTQFALNDRFDLIYTSANTIRHIVDNAAIASMWRSIAAHIAPGGLFMADLELGLAFEAAKVGKTETWMISRGEKTVHVNWMVKGVDKRVRRTRIGWKFELRDGARRALWGEEFDLRAYDAPDFVGMAAQEGGLQLVGVHEIRDPYLIETPVERATGRMIVVLRKPQV